MDAFEIRAVDLGEVKTVVAGHDGKGPGAGWFLEKVAVSDSNDPKVPHVVFACQRWFDEGVGDQQTERQLLPGDEPEEPQQQQQEQEEQEEQKQDDAQDGMWKVWTVTGTSQSPDDRNSPKDDGRKSKSEQKKGSKGKKKEEPKKVKSGVTGQVVMVLYGSDGKTEEIPLVANKELFLPGETDEFDIRVPHDLGQIYKVRVGFSESTPNDQDWFLHTLIARDLRSGNEYTFELNDQLVRTDHCEGWREIPVEPEEQRGGEEEEEDRDDEEHRVSKIKELLPVHKYIVQVYTGDRPDAHAGTNANVYMTMHGDRGDTGRRRLLRSLSKDRDMFQHNQMDLFEVEAVDMLDLKKVVIGHDGEARGSGWYLDRVVVRPAAMPNKKFVFPCQRWLETSEEDGHIERELHVLDHNWKLLATTAALADDPEEREEEDHKKGKGQKDKGKKPADKKGKDSKKGGKDAQPPIKTPSGQVLVVVYGEDGKSEELPLISEKAKKFHPGETDEYDVSIEEELGELYKVRVGYAEDTEKDQDWFLEKVVIRDLAEMKDYTFELKDHVIRDKERDGWKEIPRLPDKQPETDREGHEDAVEEREDERREEDEAVQPLPVHKYAVQVFTGDVHHGGTDANVYVTLYGARGDTGKRRLLKSLTHGDKFEEGHMDVFEIEAVDLLNLRKIVVGHDGAHGGSEWYLDRVVVRASHAPKKTFLFSYDGWLDKHDGSSEREIATAALNWKVFAVTAKPAEDDMDASNDEDTGKDPKKSNDKDKGKNKDKKGHKEQGKDNKKDTREAVQKPSGQVAIVVYGEDGKSQELPLVSDEEETFVPGEADEYLVGIEEVLGEPYKVRVGYAEDTEKDQDWFLDKVVLRDLAEMKDYTFELKDHVIRDKEMDGWKEIPRLPDKQPERDREDQEDADEEGEDERREEDEAVQALPVYKYAVQVFTGNMPHGGTDANVYVTLYGARGDTGKRRLLKSLTHGDKFEAGHMDIFEIDAVDLLNLRKIVVGHDGTHGGSDWYLDRVVVRATHAPKKKFIFSFDGWLDKHEGSAEREIEVAAINWKIIAITGTPAEDKTEEDKKLDEEDSKKGKAHDSKGKAHDPKGKAQDPKGKDKGAKAQDKDARTSGQDDQKDERDDVKRPSGQVVIVVYGEDGKSEELPLESDKEECFIPGEADEYHVQIKEELGELYKVRVGYAEDTSHNQDWFLDRLILRDVGEQKDYTFELNDHVLKDEDHDGWRELSLLPDATPDEDRQKEGDNQGDKTKDKANTKNAKDKKKGEKEKEKNKDKEKEGHEGDKEEGRKEMSATIQRIPVHNYQVEVYTGDLGNSGTDANVYLTIYGERGDTGKRHLLNSLTYGKDKFDEGHMDLFEVEAVDMLSLKKIVVGHDGEGLGSGWYLDHVVVKASPLSKKSFTFLCNRWLDEGEDDHLTERELDVRDPAETWHVEVTTDKDPGSGCHGAAVLYLYGDKGHSEPVSIVEPRTDGQQTPTDKWEFKPGETQEFTLKVHPDTEADDGLGELYKVRLGFPEEQEQEDLQWNVQQLKLRKDGTEREYVFELNGWVKLNRESDSWREIPVKQEPSRHDQQHDEKARDEEDGDGDEMLKVLQYQVEVHTSSALGSGTDADVYLQVFGERGDTGVRRMLHTKTPGNKFEAAMVDVFDVEAVELGRLEKVKVGHNGTGFGAGWHLERVLIYEAEGDSKAYLFECDKWLDEGEDDGLLERELPLTRVLGEGDEWKVLVTTNDAQNSGTNAQVTLTVLGDKGDSGPLPLGEPDKGLFETGATDKFDIVLDAEVIGKIQKIRIEHDNKEKSKGWNLEKVVLENEESSVKLEFPVKRWLDTGEEDGDIARELPASWPGEQPPNVTKYEVKTVTGREFGGGTDAKVYITLCGEKGDSGKRFLSKSQEGKDMFEKGKTDTFLVEAIDLGPLLKVIIGQDQAGGGAGWYLDKVIVKETEGGDKEYVFPCDQWLDEDEGDKKTERELMLEGGQRDGEEDKDNKEKGK